MGLKWHRVDGGVLPRKSERVVVRYGERNGEDMEVMRFQIDNGEPAWYDSAGYAWYADGGEHNVTHWLEIPPIED